MSTSPQIHPVDVANYTTWLPLWEGYQHFYKTKIVAATNDTTWQRFLNAGEPTNVILAWLNEHAVGPMYWICHRPYWTVGDYCYLQGLFVAEDPCGENMGRRLIKHVYAEAGATDCPWVHWLTHESNSDTMRLYERIADKSGFLQYRRTL